MSRRTTTPGGLALAARQTTLPLSDATLTRCGDGRLRRHCAMIDPAALRDFDWRRRATQRLIRPGAGTWRTRCVAAVHARDRVSRKGVVEWTARLVTMASLEHARRPVTI